MVMKDQGVNAVSRYPLSPSETTAGPNSRFASRRAEFALSSLPKSRKLV
jgi:hypothetical protein